MSAAKFLERLECVRQIGAGKWMARCPAHEDRSPSLSIREDRDRVLLHDFGGCNIEDVLAALGLEMSDLFERPISDGPRRPDPGLSARDLLEIFDHELLVAVLILDEVVTNRKVNSDQMKRLTQAAARIGTARDMVNPLRIPTNA